MDLSNLYYEGNLHHLQSRLTQLNHSLNLQSKLIVAIGLMSLTEAAFSGVKNKWNFISSPAFTLPLVNAKKLNCTVKLKAANLSEGNMNV